MDTTIALSRDHTVANLAIIYLSIYLLILRRSYMIIIWGDCFRILKKNLAESFKWVPWTPLWSELWPQMEPDYSNGDSPGAKEY